MPTGIYVRELRAIRIAIACKRCGAEKLFTPGVIKSKNPQYCSRECYRLDSRNNSSRVYKPCSQCGVEISVRLSHLCERNYCSRDCHAKGRLVPGAKWRDKEQIRLYMQAYVQNNKERHNEKAREWGAKNKDKRLAISRKRRLVEGSFTESEWNELKARYGNVCLCCKTETKLTVDHVIPLSKGGINTIDNIQPLCVSCNCKKGSKHIDYRN